ncbi:MAG: DUF4349 domain-containing protein [Bacteroidota bacterium]
MKILTAAFAALILVACNSQSEKTKDIAVQELKHEEEKSFSPLTDNLTDDKGMSSDSTAVPQQAPKQKQPQNNLPQTKVDWDKKIIKTGFLNAEVKNYDSFYLSVREKVRNLGGYIAQEQQEQSDYKIENSLTLKVPVDQFDNAITELTAGTNRINERKITSQDVTGEFVDTKSRMEAKREVRQRYIDLLKQAKNMQEILNVQSEINDVQGEIESAAGRINYLSHSSSYSTINLTFFQVLNISAKEYTEPSFFTKISESFKTGWQWTGNLIIGLVSIWPVILFFLGIWIMIKKYVRKVKHIEPVHK